MKKKKPTQLDFEELQLTVHDFLADVEQDHPQFTDGDIAHATLLQLRNLFAYGLFDHEDATGAQKIAAAVNDAIIRLRQSQIVRRWQEMDGDERWRNIGTAPTGDMVN